jgi:hypothetical protein
MICYGGNGPQELGGYHCRGQNEGIKVSLAHRAVDAVHRKSERQPSIDKCLNAARMIGIKIDIGLERSIINLGADANAEGVGRF